MSNEITLNKSINNSHLRTDVEKMLENKLIQLRAENESCLKTINQLQAQNTFTQQKLELLITHLNEYATYTTNATINIKLDISCEQVENFFSELKSSDKHLMEVTKEQTNFSNDTLALEFEHEKQRLKQQIHFLCTEQTTLKNALESAKNQAFALVQKLSCARNELISAEEEHRKQISSLAASFEQEKKKFGNADAERNKVLNDLLIYKQDLNSLNAYLKKEQGKNVFLEGKLKDEIERHNVLLNENISIKKVVDEMREKLNSRPSANKEDNKEIEAHVQHLEKENDRLRKHLMKMEERYTQEVLEFENEKLKMNEEIEHLNSTLSSHMSTEEDIKSNSQEKISNLNEQIRLMKLEQDELKSKLMESELTINQYSSSITNLHVVLEQYEKNHYIIQSSELEKCRRDLKVEQDKNNQLVDRIHNLENGGKLLNDQLMKLNERLKDLAKANEQIKCLQALVVEKDKNLIDVQTKLDKVMNDESIKIDKIIMKNLIMGYLHAPSSKKHEAMIIICKFLDFSVEEIKKTLETSSCSEQTRPQSSSSYNHSFSELFIDFLEKESRPRNIGVKMINENLNNQANIQTQYLPDSSRMHKSLPHFYYEQNQPKEPLHMFLQSLKQQPVPSRLNQDQKTSTNASRDFNITTNNVITDINNMSSISPTTTAKTLVQL